MANANTAQVPATKADEFDRKELTRMVARLRHEIGGLVDDSWRARPFYAKSKEEAVAKRDAAVAVLTEAFAKVEQLKKQ